MAAVSSVHQPSDGDLIARAVGQAIREQVEAEAARIVEESSSRIEAAIRDKLAEVTLRLLNHYSVKLGANEIIIRVEIGPKE